MLLTELHWEDLSPVGRALRGYAGKGLWVHFSHINKIGFKPTQRRHNDPPGIYFFPLDWLLENAERREARHGGGTSVNRFYWQSLPHWFVCEANLGEGGLVLSQVTWDQMPSYTQRFGIEDIYESWQVEKTGYLVPSWSANKPGAVLYNLMKYKEQKGTPWGQLLRGVRYIYDDVAAIYNKEPKQLILRDPSLFRVIDSGSQRQIHGAVDTSSFDEFWRVGLSEVMRDIAERMKGTYTWKPRERHEKPLPRVAFAIGDREFVLRVSDKFGVSLLLDYRHGRAKGQMSINSEDLLTLSRADLAARVESMAREIAARESDLLFKPVVSEQQFAKWMETRIAKGQEFDWTVEIDNEDSIINMWGVTEYEVDDLPFRVMLFGRLHETHFDASFNVRCAGKAMLERSSYGEYDPSTTDNLLSDLTERLELQLITFTRPHDPSLPWDRINAEPRLSDPGQYQAFVGWCAANCGVTLEGRIERMFADNIKAFRDYPDQRALALDVRYVLKSRRY